MKDLSIPEKISLEKELAPGIWRKDLPKLLTMAIPGLIVGIIVWALSSDYPLTQFVIGLAIIIYLSICFVLIARIDGTQSILSFLELKIRFRREQQHFYYKQGKEKLYHVYHVEENRPQYTDST